MTKLNIISSVLIYIFFAQVSPYIHWHAQEHKGEIDLRVSIHPPEISTDVHQHHDTPDEATEHEHDDFHFIMDLDHTFQVRTLPNILIENSTIIITRANIENQVVKRRVCDIPLKIPWHHHPVIIPNRAPPSLS